MKIELRIQYYYGRTHRHTEWLLELLAGARNKCDRLSNGLIRRDFVTEPNFGTIDLYSLEDDSSLLRAFSPESKLSFYCEGENFTVTVGGVTANVPRGYLNRSATKIEYGWDQWIILRTGLKLEKFDGHVFVYDKHIVSKISSDITWSPTRGAPAASFWPPRGLHLEVSFQIYRDIETIFCLLLF